MELVPGVLELFPLKKALVSARKRDWRRDSLDFDGSLAKVHETPDCAASHNLVSKVSMDWVEG